MANDRRAGMAAGNGSTITVSYVMRNFPFIDRNPHTGRLGGLPTLPLLHRTLRSLTHTYIHRQKIRSTVYRRDSSMMWTGTRTNLMPSRHLHGHVVGGSRSLREATRVPGGNRVRFVSRLSLELDDDAEKLKKLGFPAPPRKASKLLRGFP